MFTGIPSYITCQRSSYTQNISTSFRYSPQLHPPECFKISSGTNLYKSRIGS